MCLLCFSVFVVIFSSTLCDFVFFFFKQKTAYEMRISDWSSDVCSSDLRWDRCDHRPVARDSCSRTSAPPGKQPGSLPEQTGGESLKGVHPLGAAANVPAPSPDNRPAERRRQPTNEAGRPAALAGIAKAIR